MKFEDKILNLIYSKSEGGYWDFKRSWHVDDGCLLHDIICLANNIENRDCYIIIGIDENNDFEYYHNMAEEGATNNDNIAGGIFAFFIIIVYAIIFIAAAFAR